MDANKQKPSTSCQSVLGFFHIQKGSIYPEGYLKQIPLPFLLNNIILHG
jgi:hypothetical protein